MSSPIVEYDWEFIDKVVYINLEYRTDRRKRMEHLTRTFGDKVIRFSAIKDDRDGAVGCLKSHLAVLNLAVEKQWKNVLVLEDDVEFYDFDNGIKHLECLVKSPYDVIMLGGTTTEFDTKTFKVSNSQSAASYLVNNHYFEILRNTFNEGLKNLLLHPEGHQHLYSTDRCWCELQRRDNWYIVFPSLMYQAPDYSDIVKGNVDYRPYFGVKTL
jgi:GR25 family glycosyltransferase involved in LPS biosynthesis